MNCESDQFLKESITCQICNTDFHATCYKRAGTAGSDFKAICTPTFLATVRPLISKYGTHANRWGQFMFVCVNCDKWIEQKRSERTT